MLILTMDEACLESKCTDTLMTIDNIFLLSWLHCHIALLLSFKTRPKLVM